MIFKTKSIFLSFLLGLFTICTWADDNTHVRDYYVEMMVHGDNSYDVYEEITAHFDAPHHGIYRYVPEKFYISGQGHPVDVTDIEVGGDVYSLDEENQNRIIQIGDPDNVVTGDKTYSISYRLTNYDDRDNTRDLFYHSVLGSDFQLPIDTLSFIIVFEKGIPKDAANNLKVFSGDEAFKGNALNAEVEIDGDTIFGIVTDIPVANAVTLFMPLKEGYFIGEKTISPTLAYIFLAIVVLLLAIIFFYEFKIKHPGITRQIEFYPPDGMCSAEVGTVIDDSVDDVDIASLIPWYAREGYLSIEEKKENGEKYLEIHKLKEADSNWEEYQKTFFNILFPSNTDSSRLDKLPEAAKEMEKTKDQLRGLFLGDHKLTSTHNASFLEFPLWIFSTLLFIAAMPCELFSDENFGLIFFFWSFPFACGYVINLVYAAGRMFEKGWVKKTWFVVRAIIMLVCLWAQLHLLDEPIISRYIVIAVYIACFMSVELCTRLVVDTEYRASLMGRLLGLKEFIETAEEPRLKSLLEADPQYFYRILPYAMVFEVSDIWAEHFRNIEMEQPEWYHSSSTDAFATYGFVSSLNSATSNAISTISPSSSDSSDGGGCSGGGSGGGGGGAW